MAMGENEDTDVLKQVEVLFKKLESAPENVKAAAISKIRERLMPGTYERVDGPAKKEPVNTRPKRGNHRRKPVGDNTSTLQQKAYSHEYNVKEVTTKRGRRAKQFNYNSDSGTESSLVEVIPSESIASAEDSETEKSVIAVTEEAVCDSSDLQALRDGVGENVFVVETTTAVKPEEVLVTVCSRVDGKDNEAENVLLKGATVQCSVCYKECNDRIDLRNHLKEEHISHGMYICKQCGHFFPKAQTLKIHMKRHRGERDFSCANCDYRTYTKAELERHSTVHTDHTDDRTFVCHHCGKVYAVYKSLQEHIRSVHEQSSMHVCEECGFTTCRAAYLQVHIRTVHLGNYNSHVCPVCDAHVKQRNAFLEHMRSHTGDRPFRCDKCSASFACSARLTVHQKSVHGPRTYQCSTCSKAFQTKHHLERHQVIHTKKRPFKCPYCSYSCNAQGNMIKHVRTVHGRLDFSYRRYKRQQLQQKGVLPAVPDPEWVGRGEEVSQQYLEKLSEKLGRKITVKELREKESHRERTQSTTSKYRKLNTASKTNKNVRAECFVLPETADHSYVSTVKDTIIEKTTDAGNKDSELAVKRLSDGEESSVHEKEVQYETNPVSERVFLVQCNRNKGEQIKLLVGTEVSEDIGHIETEPPTLQLVYHNSPRPGTLSDVEGRGTRVEVQGGGYLTSNFVALSGIETEKNNAAPTVIVVVDTDQNSSLGTE
ncbi:zinc finger protein 595-like isoform X1 [Schistocerca nitens]|uniref:zinc finger protein 595-like isoform X1 n=1 Tax=Schistocerca nitens TaxID=7011 RepID=UPI0021197FAA|nr:zinc finger protein 595-like isoform X1 [Schistocerca nitens]